MPNFNWSCLLLTTTYDSVEILVNGETEAVDRDPIKQAEGLFGAVKVSYKVISADEPEYVPVNTYKEIWELCEQAVAYGEHLEFSIDRYDTDPEITDMSGYTIDEANDIIEECAPIAAAYQKIKSELLPSGSALFYILNGTNELGHKVWLDTSVTVEPKVAPARPPRPVLTPQQNRDALYDYCDANYAYCVANQIK